MPATMPATSSPLPHALPTSLAQMLAIDLDTIDVTRSPNADAKLLSAIARPIWLQHQTAAGGHISPSINTPTFTRIPHQIRWYRFDQKRRWSTLQKLAIQHPSIEIDDALQLAQWYPALFWKNAALPLWLLEKPDLLQGASNEVKRAFADCPSTPSEFLEQIVDGIAHQPYYYLFQQTLKKVASNPQCPPALLRRLADDVDEAVRIVAGPRVLSLDTSPTPTYFLPHQRLGSLPRLKNPDDTQYWQRVDLSVDGESIHQWAEVAVIERRWYLCLLAIKHPNILPKTLQMFIKVPQNICARLHNAASIHPQLPMDCIEELLDAIPPPIPPHQQAAQYQNVVGAYTSAYVGGYYYGHDDESIPEILHNPQLSSAQLLQIFRRQCYFDAHLGHHTIPSYMLAHLLQHDAFPADDLAAFIRNQPTSLCPDRVYVGIDYNIYTRTLLAQRKSLPIEVMALLLTDQDYSVRTSFVEKHPIDLDTRHEKTATDALDRLYIPIFQLGSTADLSTPLSTWLYWCLRKILHVSSSDAAAALEHTCSAAQIRWLVTESIFSFDKTAAHCRYLHQLVVQHPNTPTDVLELIWRWHIQQLREDIERLGQQQNQQNYQNYQNYHGPSDTFYQLFSQLYLRNPQTPAWIIQEIYNNLTERNLGNNNYSGDSSTLIRLLSKHPQTPQSILAEILQSHDSQNTQASNTQASNTQASNKAKSPYSRLDLWTVRAHYLGSVDTSGFSQRFSRRFYQVLVWLIHRLVWLGIACLLLIAIPFVLLLSPFFISSWWSNGKRFWQTHKKWIVAQVITARRDNGMLR